MFRFLGLSIAVAAVAAFVDSSARADWQYTRWGMTVEQVLAASKGRVSRCDSRCNGQSTDDLEARLVGRYQAGDFDFDLFALFNKRDGRLETISLNLRRPQQVHDLIGALTKKYGRPVDTMKGAVLRAYIWRDLRDQISVVEIGSGARANVSLKYQARLTRANEGL